METKILKSYLTTKSVADDASRTITSVITTDAVDRDGEVVVPAGLDWSEFERNPVVLWSHDFKRPPVGKCVGLTRLPRGWEAKTEFAATDRGEELYRLYRDDMLNGFSIGMLPDRKSYGRPTAQELTDNPSWKGARAVVRKARVFEYSACCMPVNPEAMRRAYGEGSLVLSKALASDLQLANEPLPEAPAFVTHLSGKELTRAVEQYLEQADLGNLFSRDELLSMWRERLDVACGKVA